MAKYRYKDGVFSPEMYNSKVVYNKELVYTDFKIIKDNVDKEYITKDGTIHSTKQDGYLGIWSLALEKDARTYYIVQDEHITEVILYKQPNNDEPYYIIEINGYMYNCIPEDDDIIYSTYKEARIELMTQQEEQTANIQVKQQI